MSRLRFSLREKIGLAVALGLVFGFGVNLEQRTALRRVPKTDLGVFTAAAWAVLSGEDLYAVRDWHGWHYHYPPTWAILMIPLADPPPEAFPPKGTDEVRTASNTPWGYGVPGHRFYGLHQQNLRFFLIVAGWYVLSLGLCLLAVHALACVLEGKKLSDVPPIDPTERNRWWALRLIPLLVCVGSIATDFSRGQADIALLAAVAFGLYLAAQQRELQAGFWLALPMTVKLFPPFLLLYPIWQRRWRMTAGVAVGLFVLLVALPVLALGPRRTIESYREWKEVLVKPSFGTGHNQSRRQELTGMTSTDNQSLLAAIHEWRYRGITRKVRPQEASAAERNAVYFVGGLMLGIIGFVLRGRRLQSPRESLLLSGLLIGLALVVSPVVHNYYYLLMLPLVVALIHPAIQDPLRLKQDWKFVLPVLLFMVTDMMVRFPVLGSRLRDLSLPLLSLLWLLGAALMELLPGDKAACELKMPVESPAGAS